MTPLLCKSQCAGWKKNYAALASGRYCFCSSVLPDPTWEEAGGASCNEPCAASAGDMCGGLNHVTVYEVTLPIEDVQVKCMV